MSVNLQRLRVPFLERLALADLAERRGESEEATLQRIIREAVKRECVKLATGDQGQDCQAQPQEVTQP